MKKPFVLGINGSPHKRGHVAKMLKTSLRTAEKAGAVVRIVDLVDHKILPHSGYLTPHTYKEKTDDDMPQLQQLVLEADGIIFATPTHWFAPSSLMKLFIDRLTSLEDYAFLLEGTVAGFLTYGPQGGALNAAMNLMAIANHWGMVCPPYSIVFDEGRRDKWVMKDCSLLGKNIVQLVNLQKNQKVNWGYEKL